MTIALLCPNGHKLLCPDEQAGKRGKCPHCGATFRVPELKPGSGPLVNASGSGITGGSGPKLADGEGPLVGSGIGLAGGINVGGAPVVARPVPAFTPPPNPLRAAAEDEPLGSDEVAFLCPNGHQLAGVASLGGQPGQCPVCDVKFLIPTDEELVEPAEAPFNPLLSGAPGTDDSPEFNKDRPTIAEFFDRLWAYKSTGGVVEVYLKDGQTSLVPDGYSKILSQASEAVFLVREADGTYLVAIVAWQSISHLTLRRLETPPPDTFEIP